MAAQIWGLALREGNPTLSTSERNADTPRWCARRPPIALPFQAGAVAPQSSWRPLGSVRDGTRLQGV